MMNLHCFGSELFGAYLIFELREKTFTYLEVVSEQCYFEGSRCIYIHKTTEFL
jgi:hypothetical protein